MIEAILVFANPMYERGPEWSPVKRAPSLAPGHRRLFLVSNARPLRMAIAYLHPERTWFADAEGMVPLDFTPTYFGEPPCWPPWTREQAEEQ